MASYYVNNNAQTNGDHELMVAGRFATAALTD